MKHLIVELKQALYEDLGIRYEVKDAYRKVKEGVIKDSKKTRFTTKDIYGNRLKKGSFNLEVFNGVNVNISYYIIYLGNRSEMADAERNYVHWSSYNSNTNTLKTLLFYIDNEKKYVDKASQHELDHVYKSLIRNQSMPKKPVSKKIYQKAVAGASSTDALTKLVSYVIYYNNNFERDAFGNDIYSAIMQNQDKDMYSVVEETNVYRNILIIRKFIENINPKTKDIIEDIVYNTYGKHFKWWYNIAQRVVKQYIRKIGRAMAKAKYDIDGDNVNIFGGPNDLISEE